MIDLTNVSEIKNVLSNKVIDRIEDTLGNVIYEAYKKLKGIPPFTITSKGQPLKDYKIYGNSIQDGTPSPSNPVEIESVGDLVTDVNDTNYGKYQISVGVYGENIFDKNSTNYLSAYVSNGNITSGANMRTYIVKVNPNTTYTIVYDNSNVSSRPRLSVTGFSETPYIGLSGGQVYYQNTSEAKRHVVTFTTGANIEYLCLWFLYGSDNIEYFLDTVLLELNISTTNIYLDNPLRRVGNYADYIDYENQKVYRNVIVDDDSGEDTIANSYSGTIDTTGTSIALPSIPTITGTTIISVDTEVQPSSMYIKYK